MDIARVIGHVVSSSKHESLVGTKLCVLQPLDEQYKEFGAPLIAVDVDSRVGGGEIVFFVTSGDATKLEKDHPMPIDAAVVGIVDNVEADREYVKKVGSLRKYKKY